MPNDKKSDKCNIYGVQCNKFKNTDAYRGDTLYTMTEELENMQGHRHNRNSQNARRMHVQSATRHVLDAFIQNSLWCNACILGARNLSGNKIKG